MTDPFQHHGNASCTLVTTFNEHHHLTLEFKLLGTFGGVWFCETFPYFLPNLITAIFGLVGGICVHFLLPETLPREEYAEHSVTVSAVSKPPSLEKTESTGDFTQVSAEDPRNENSVTAVKTAESEPTPDKNGTTIAELMELPGLLALSF